jgi:hypothetical protein
VREVGGDGRWEEMRGREYKRVRKGERTWRNGGTKVGKKSEENSPRPFQ